MLVLSRRRNESIMIGDEVEVTIVDFRGDKVRIGIRAPDSVSVHRKEIYEAIKDENQQAASVLPEDLDPTAAPSAGPHLAGEAGARAIDPKSAQGAARPPTNGAHKAQQPVKLNVDQNKGNQGQGQHMTKDADPFLRAAIDEARLGLMEGGLPIGSVLVRNGKIIARGHNRRVQRGDPMAHAEIDCLTNAGRQRTYKDTVLYSTLMPCYLCSGAVVQFGIPKVIVGESVNFGGGPDFMRSKGVQVTDLQDAECIQMMKQFIQAHPELWNEDIGK